MCPLLREVCFIWRDLYQSSLRTLIKTPFHMYVCTRECVMVSHSSRGSGVSLPPLVALRAAATADSAPSVSPWQPGGPLSPPPSPPVSAAVDGVPPSKRGREGGREGESSAIFRSLNATMALEYNGGTPATCL